MPTMNNMPEVMRECEKLSEANQGWICVPSDDPEAASFGMVAFRSLDKDGNPAKDGNGAREERIRFEWLPYGRRLQPEIVVAADPKKFRALVDALRPDGIFRCDDPVRRHVGFVSYLGGTARIVRMPMTALKSSPDILGPLAIEILIGTARRG